MGSAAAAERLAQRQMLARAVKLLQSGQDRLAGQVLEAVLGRWPEQADALHFLGILRHRQGDSEAALSLLQRAIEQMPGEPGPWNNLGNILFALHRYPQAEQAYRECLLRNADFAEALGNLASACARQGRLAEAAPLYRRALELDPGNAILQHHLASCDVDSPPARASDAYLSAVFDRDAEAFDQRLQSLQYRGPQQIASDLSETIPPPAARLKIADLGCGTGLCGPLLRPWAERLVGCDLSAGMLEHARRRGVYDELQQVDMFEFLRGSESAFHGLVCVDTLIYVGDLYDLAAAAARALLDEGWFAFTVEALPDAADRELILQNNGRYAHHRRHVDAALQAAGLQVLMQSSFELRVEAGQAVPGLSCIALRS